MKINGTFVAVIVVLMAVMILFEMKAPSRFDWYDQEYSCNSKQPFGCYVMDSVLRASLPQGYEVRGQNIKMRRDMKLDGKLHTFLFVNSHGDFISSHDVDFLEMIKAGNNVVIAADYVGYNTRVNDVCEALGFSYRDLNDIYMNNYSYREILSDPSLIDTISWQRDGLFDSGTYLISSAFSSRELYLSDSYRVLATIDKEGGHQYDYGELSAVAAVRDYGKGRVAVMSMPMLFTNYGILDDAIRPLLLRLLSECGDKPVVRYDSTYYAQEEPDEEDADSPLRYLLANRPLRWALYLALATLVAFVFFSARRRQRVIPVIKPPVNHMMDFVKRIGGIYYKRHDNVDLLGKKYATFSNDLRVKAMIDIDNRDTLDDELQSLSSRTGIPFTELRQHIHDLQDAMRAASIDDRKLQQLIDMMNDILHRINI